MLKFTRKIVVHVVTAEGSPESHKYWRDRFAACAPDGFTVFLPEAVEGGWRMADGSVVTEPVSLFEVWEPSVPQVVDVLTVASQLQTDENQEAVSVQWVSPTGWVAAICFDSADWLELETLIRADQPAD